MRTFTEVPAADWQPLHIFCAMTGLKPADVESKIARGMWRDGLHWRRGAGGLEISLPGFEAWVERRDGEPPAETPKQQQPERRKRQANDGPTQLYRHFDASDTLLYVGISLSVTARLGAHMVGSHWADAIARVDVERFPTRAHALAAERAAIIAEKPVHNIVHASRP